MFKDYNRYLSASLKVYLFVLVIIFIMKLIGIDYFGLNINNEIIIKLSNFIKNNIFINNIIFFIPLIFNHFVVTTYTCNDNSKNVKIYIFITLPIFYLLECYKFDIFKNFAPIIEILYLLLNSCIYCKLNKKKIKVLRYVFIMGLITLIQVISILTRSNYKIEYIDNPIANIILNLDYIVMLLIIYKLNFMRGGEKTWVDGYQVEAFYSSLKKTNLLTLLKRLQRNLNKFKKQDKETKLTIIIYFILSLIWNVLTVVIVLVFAKLNNTLIECIFIMTSFWLTKHVFGKAFHLPSMVQYFIVSNLTYYVLNRITTPLGISIIIPIMLGVGLSYLTSKLVKKTYKPLYRGMSKDLFEETILKVVDKDSDKYKICYEYFIEKKSAVSLSMKYNYSEAGIKKIKDRINNKIKELN